MTVATTHAAAGHQPASVTATIATLVFLGVTAVAGGAGLIFQLGAMAPPADWLDRIPLIDNWIVPGLVLGVGFGVGALVTAWGMRGRRRWPWLMVVQRWSGHHWSWLATLVLGVGQAVWIMFEFVYLPLSGLEFVYAGVAVALIVLPLLASTRRHLAMPQ